MEAISGQLHRQPQQKSGEPSSMGEGLGQRVEQLVHLRRYLQDSNSQNMLHAFPSLLDLVMRKTPYIGLRPMCLLWMPLAANKTITHRKLIILQFLFKPGFVDLNAKYSSGTYDQVLTLRRV